MRFHLSHRTVVVAALLAAVVLALSGWTTLASAAPQRSSAASAPTVPATFIQHKITLPDTSISGPALSSTFGTFEGVTSRQSAIAWIGTDAAHHLNVMTSTDGLHFSHKRTLNETSPFRPDVTQMTVSAGGSVTVAWTGTDANHSLNVLFDVYGAHPQKLTLSHESSYGAPAILQWGNKLVLAWTGTDALHQLNMLPITLGASGLVPGHKSITGLLSSSGPRLALAGSGVVLSWVDNDRGLTAAATTDGVTFPEIGRLDDETSAVAPTMTAAPAGPGPNGWIGWTGTDPAHHLNLQWTSSYPEFPIQAGNKTTLSETALGGPAVATTDTILQIAWTGTDSAHHLNIAQFALQ